MHELAKVRGGEGCMKIQRKSGRKEWQGWKARNVIRCFLPRRKFEGREKNKNGNVKQFYYFFRERERECTCFFFLFEADCFFLFLFFDGCLGARFSDGLETNEQFYCWKFLKR